MDMCLKGEKLLALILALGAALTSLPAASAQVKGKSNPSVSGSAKAGVEPLRVINGQMSGRIIAGQFKAHGRKSDFSFKISGAEIVDGKLQLTGDFRMGQSPRAGEPVKARLAGIMAKAANPWPQASDEKPKAQANEQQQGREAKDPETAAQLGQLAQSTQDTARKTPPAPGERNEQTQSLYAQSEMANECGAYFLSIDAPPRLRAARGAGARPVQLGFILAPFDNRPGEEVSKRLCAIVRLSGEKSAGGRLSASVDEFNRFLSSLR
jgi:hypothetical protein